MRALFAGDSHITSLGVPLVAPNNIATFYPVPGFDEAGAFTGTWPRGAKYWTALAETPPRPVFLLWQGNQAAAKYLVGTGIGFDFALDGEAPAMIEDNCTIIPESALEAQLSAGLPNLKRIVNHLRDNGFEPIISATPAPKGDDSYIRSVILKENTFVRKLERMGVSASELVLVPGHIRLKLWRLLMRTYASFAASHDLPFLDAPAGTLDSAGFLKRELYAHDATHANNGYADYLIPHALEFLESLR